MRWSKESVTEACEIATADLGTHQRGGFLGDICFNDEPASKVVRSKRLENRGEIDKAFSQLGKDTLATEGAVIPILLTTFG